MDSGYQLSNVRMYPGDRKILELLTQNGVFEIVTRYDKEDLISFESQRVS